MNKKIEKMGALYSKLLPADRSRKNPGYADLVSNLISDESSPVQKQARKSIPPMADYVLTEDEDELSEAEPQV